MYIKKEGNPYDLTGLSGVGLDRYMNNGWTGDAFRTPDYYCY